MSHQNRANGNGPSTGAPADHFPAEGDLNTGDEAEFMRTPEGAPAMDLGGSGGVPSEHDEDSEHDRIASLVRDLELERQELKDKVLRTLAEMENLRRRTERDVADAKAYAVTSFARDMLNVADNLRRALDAVPQSNDQPGEIMTALIDGVDLTERDLLKILERHGVKKIDPMGEKFDPHRHQAIFEMPNADVPSGTVMQVVQSGFVIADRVLRPAMVGVAKGGPKA